MVSFTLALIRSIGHISLSSLHRQMQRDHENVCNDLSCKQSHCISRVQLRRLLISIDQEELKTLTNHYFAIELRQTDDLEWFALDGKELKGSIDKVMGKRRGENIILKVNHNQQSSQVIDFYSGQKESEKTTVKNYIQACSDLSNQAFSLDALHNSVSLLSLIEAKNGIYLTQIKQNQKYLLEELQHIEQHLSAFDVIQKDEKGHGRVEQRKAWFYPINHETLPKEWKNTNIQCLICIERNIWHSKKQHHSQEKSYYISNLSCSSKNTTMLFQAIRNHWKVEINNYIRDVSFGEDKFLSFNSNLQKSVSIFLNLTFNTIKKMVDQKHYKYFIQVREECCWNRKFALKSLKLFS